MKTINSLRSKLLALTLALMASVSTFAYDYHGDLLCYNVLTDSTVAVTGQSEYKTMPRYEYLPENLVIPAEVTLQGKTYKVVSIDQWAFYACTMLKSVTIPSSVTFIGLSAFQYCENLVNVDIPTSVTTVEGSAFSYTKWYDNLPDGEVYINNTLYRYKGTVPENTQIVVKDGTTRIAGFTFWNQSNIVSIELPQSLTVIEQCAFEGCTQLSSILIPKNVTFIGCSAFAKCTGLMEVICLAPTPPIAGVSANPSPSDWMFAGVEVSKIPLYVPAESIDLYKEAEQWMFFNPILPIEPTSYKSQWCNKWNVMWFDGMRFDETASTSQYRLGKDTVIGDYIYSKFTSRTSVRFTSNRKVYVYYEGFDDNDPYTEDLPTGEYLAYDFSAQVGDTLEVFSGSHSYTTEQCVVYDVQTDPETNLRTIMLHPLRVVDSDGNVGVSNEEITWLEGVGSPNGFLISTPLPGGGLFALLCAYKGDELKYTGSFYERFGCEYNAGVVSDDLFPTLSGLQRAICREYYEQADNKTRMERFTNLTTRTETGAPYIYCSPFLLREKDNKILIYSRSLNKDLVLYDFNLQVGDSLPMLYIDFFAKDDWIADSDMEIWCIVDYHKDLEGNILPADTLIVTDVSAITLLDGKEYKKWTFNNGMEYVEGIGSFGNRQWSGDFFQLIANRDVPTSLQGEHLVCVSKNGQLLYKMDDAEMEQLETECLCEIEPKWSETWCNQWNILSHGYLGPQDPLAGARTSIYWLSNNTVNRNGQEYIPLMCSSSMPNEESTLLVGELRFTEDKQVYFYYAFDETEYLLYDFGAELGDTLELFAGLEFYNYHKTYTHVITDKETLDDGRLQIQADVVIRIDNGAGEYFEEKHPVTWIEGLGSTYGIIFNPSNPGVAGDGAIIMLCAYRDDECVYTTNFSDYKNMGCVYNNDGTVDEDLFPMLAGLQRTVCNEFCGDTEDDNSSNTTYKQTFDKILFERDQPYIYCNSAFLLREENNKILIYSHSLDKDLVLYDFTLEVGDSLPQLYLDEEAKKDIYWIYYEYMNVVDYNKYNDSIYPADTLIVTDVSMITLLDGKEYKKWTFNNGMEYVEGIGMYGGRRGGNFFGLIQEVVVPCHTGTHLVCVSKNGQLLYQMDDAEMERLGAECLCEAENPEDLFPTLWGLQQTICSGYYGEEGDEWASGLTGPSQEITMMDGKPYLQWGSWYLREENDKILVYSEIQKKDLVLYDFTLELGDTLTTLNLVTPEFLEYEGIVGIVDYPLSDYEYTYPIDTLVVTELSKETLLDGKEYTRWKFSDGTVYVEGIGSMSETFFHHIADHLPVPVSYLGSYLVCVSKNNKLLYQMDPVKMDELGAECLCDYDRGPRKDNAKDGQIGGRPTPTQWNQLEVVLREMDNNHTILQAETFSYTLEDISQQVNNKTYFQLARQSTKDTATTKSVVGALHFGKDEDNRVYFLRDGVEYVLYDFTAEIGDTVEIFAGINNYPQETTYTHVVVDKDTTEDGACRMFLEVVFPEETTTAENAEKVWLAGLGSVDGIVHNAAKRTSNAHAAPSRSASSSETESSVMLCAWREDSCLYTTNHPDYETFGCVYNQDPTSVEDISTSQSSYQKIIREGQFLILHNGKTYSIMGIEL